MVTNWSNGVLLDRLGRPEGRGSLESVLRGSRVGQRDAATELASTGMLEVEPGVKLGASVLESTLLARLAAAQDVTTRDRINRILDNLDRSHALNGAFEPRGSMQTWQETIVMSSTDGPPNTAGTRASCIPVANRIVLPNNFFYVGRILKVMLSGRISCAVTTPGTARFDLCLGAAGTTIVFDSLALNLNVVAKTTVPFYVEIKLICRAVGTGTSTTFFPMNSYFTSEAVVGSPLPTVGGNGSLLIPVGTPAVGAGMDNTAASALDVFFTQTVATGSMTVHNYQVDVLN